eukprot:TRINITY_DN11544_c0_g1_i1.p1 TRINITY_DN11544_c0_g1~~TRINITY_DN11544_c0_g1_i1.p1  ORF type:complete len:716 (+),score=222.72 TRINITY_DN11544_c0_g1_i1:100-2148(+)
MSLFGLVVFILIIGADGRNALKLRGLDSPRLFEQNLWCGKPYLADGGLDTLTEKRVDAEPAPLSARRATVEPGLSLYTDEPQASLLVTTPSTSECERLSFSAWFGHPRQTLVSDTFVASGRTVTFEFDAALLPLGQTLVSYSLVGAKISETSAVVVARLPPADHEVKIDNRNGALLVDGLPFVPFGFYFSFSTLANALALVQPELMNGMTTVLPYRPYGAPTSDFMQFMDACAAMKFTVILDMSAEGPLPESPTKWALIKQIVAAVQNHSALLGYYIADEPDGPGTGLNASVLLDVKNFINQLDPYHPTILVLNCWPSAPRYASATDIMMTDPYPIGLQQQVGCDTCGGTVLDVGLRAQHYRQQLSPSQPLWMVLQAFSGCCEHWSRDPTAREERVMTYLSLVNRATGLLYFLEDYPVAEQCWTEVRRFGLEVQELLPYVLSWAPPLAVTSNWPNVFVASFRIDYDVVVLAVNADNQGHPLTITLPDLPWAATAEVMFEQGSQIAISGNVINDAIMAYSTRAYHLRITNSSMSARMPVAAGNIILNPSFENQSSIGIPDDYQFALGADGCSCLADARLAMDGFHSLRVTSNTAVSPTGPISYWQQLNASVTYTLSVWALSDEPGTVLLLNTQKFPLTTSWALYTTSFAPNADGRYSVQAMIQEVGRVWLDMLQLVPQATSSS